MHWRRPTLLKRRKSHPSFRQSRNIQLWCFWWELTAAALYQLLFGYRGHFTTVLHFLHYCAKVVIVPSNCYQIRHFSPELLSVVEFHEAVELGLGCLALRFLYGLIRSIVVLHFGTHLLCVVWSFELFLALWNFIREELGVPLQRKLF